MRVIGDQDEATLETLQSVFVNYTNAEFPAWGRTRSVLNPRHRQQETGLHLHRENQPSAARPSCI